MVSEVATHRIQPKFKPRYDVERVVADMGALGWNNVALAAHADLCPSTITNFLKGQQTPRTAKKIASALGYSVRRYYLHVERVA